MTFVLLNSSGGAHTPRVLPGRAQSAAADEQRTRGVLINRSPVPVKDAVSSVGYFGFQAKVSREAVSAY